MRIVIFGGAGFLGSHVADILINAGHYETTPYSYAPQIGIKYSPNRHVDLGQVF